jgi:hypothetical protein
MAVHEIVYVLDQVGLPKDIQKAMRMVTETIMLVNSLRLTLDLLMAENPVAWPIIAVHGIQTAIMGGVLASNLSTEMDRFLR